MYTKVKKANETGIHYPVRVDAETGKASGEHADDFFWLQGRSKLSILIDSWCDVDDELKDNIWTDITVFILYSIICFTNIFFV